MRKILTAAALAALVAGPALAADLPVKVPYKVPVYSWNGCYIGGNVGWARERVHDYWLPDSAFAPGAIVALNAASDATLSKSGVVGGGQIGCNFQQAGSWVVWGVEGDFDWTSLNVDRLLVATNVGGPPPLNFTDDQQMKLSFVSTARVRVGTTFYSNWLVYATGGFAFANITYSDCSVHFPNPPPAFCDTSGAAGGGFNFAHFNQTKFGYAVGGGIEIPWQEWSIKAEYLYVGIPRVNTLSQCFVTPGVACGGATDIEHVHSNFNVQMARIGLNYHFNCCSPVVRAAY